MPDVINSINLCAIFIQASFRKEKDLSKKIHNKRGQILVQTELRQNDLIND